MNGSFTLFGLILSWCFLGVGGWFGWQLLRQNGRMLLRLDELEKQLDEFGFSEGKSDHRRASPSESPPEIAEIQRTTGETPASPPSLSEVADRHEETSSARHSDDGALRGVGNAHYLGDRLARFGSRSLTRSKINRAGLNAGTPAPNFRLPRLDGRGDLSLEEFRGCRVLLIFSDPHCGPCNALAPGLEKFHRENRSGVGVLMISRGDPKENRAKVAEHGLTFPVVLQHHWEISLRYALFATPMAYLIDETGLIASDVAVGVEPIRVLLNKAKRYVSEACPPQNAEASKDAH